MEGGCYRNDSQGIRTKTLNAGFCEFVSCQFVKTALGWHANSLLGFYPCVASLLAWNSIERKRVVVLTQNALIVGAYWLLRGKMQPRRDWMFKGSMMNYFFALVRGQQNAETTNFLFSLFVLFNTGSPSARCLLFGMAIEIMNTNDGLF
ncbi:MAG TPA: hypothetical protein VK152_02945 [Paludibacter sp.]|nr:hypothetical protein [Paludibacter sp.]